jgi:anti-sigma28 factor (negative regulator of flagellin synthesis)
MSDKMRKKLGDYLEISLPSFGDRTAVISRNDVTEEQWQAAKAAAEHSGNVLTLKESQNREKNPSNVVDKEDYVDLKDPVTGVVAKMPRGDIPQARWEALKQRVSSGELKLDWQREKSAAASGASARIRANGSGGFRTESGLRLANDPLEHGGVGDGQFGQHLAVQEDVGFLESGDELGVGHAERAHAGVDPDDPELAEIALLVLAPGVGVLEGLGDLLDGLAPTVIPVGIITLGDLENLLLSLPRVDSAFDSHGTLSFWLVLGRPISRTGASS